MCIFCHHGQPHQKGHGSIGVGILLGLKGKSAWQVPGSPEPIRGYLINSKVINAKLGQNIWKENEDVSSSNPHHTLTGPFSAHMHCNSHVDIVACTLAAHDLTSSAT
eukprot:4632999-Ditylum_brightwellii.AAC.1